MKNRRFYSLLTGALLLAFAVWLGWRSVPDGNPNPRHRIGEALDNLDGVQVFYNGRVGHSGERNRSDDGYNIGIRYQCVEFVKRYYYEHFHHKMPDSFGHAKDFFDPSVPDGGLNSTRGLLQFTNPSSSRPQYGDLIVFDGHDSNPYGHVAIVSKVNDDSVEIIQQNPGPFASSRETFPLASSSVGFRVDSERALGWLRIAP